MEQEKGPVIELLRQHDLRITGCRKDILELFMHSQAALSQPEVEKEFGDEHDRVTIYRTLASFMEKGLLHKVPDDAGAARYALCSGCREHEHHDSHIHFKCQACGSTHCLDEIQFPNF